MTAARLPGGSAGLMGCALAAAFGIFVLGSGCSPSTGSPAPGVVETGSTPSRGGRPPGAGGGAVSAAGGATGGGSQPAGGSVPGGGQSGGGDPPVGGSPPVGGTGGDVAGAPSAGGLPNVGGTCNVQVVDPTPLPPCPSCTGGRCVNAADYPTAPTSQLATCGNTAQICLPDSLVATQGNVALPHCTSVAGAEGRCTSLCIPIANSLSGVLPQDTCSTTDRCGPCFNPVDGTSTGICTIGCDPGPTKPAVLFPTCCVDKSTGNARGRCVPRAAIPDGPAKTNLSKETCSGSNDPVCVPTAIIQDPTYKFPTCTSQLFIDPGKPGVCVPKCIVDANAAGSALAQDDCADATDKCVPCTNPSTGQPSGACDTP